MIEIKVPDLGESITEGTIANWLKEEGDEVHEGDIVVELETDKVNLEINAEQSGVLKEIVKQPGDTVEVGEVIALVVAEGEADGDESERDGVERDEVKRDEVKNDEVEGGTLRDAPATPAEQNTAQGDAQGNDKQDDRKHDPEESQATVVASPAVRKLAREKGIDLRHISTRDPLSRVTAEDVEAHADRTEKAADGQRSAQPGPVKPDFGQKKAGGRPTGQKGAGQESARRPAPSQAAPGRQDLEQWDTEIERPVERQRMSRRRQTIAKRLVEAQHTAAMLTTFNEVDMSAILEVRKRRKEAFKEKYDVGLGFMSFFTKAVVGALKQFPLLNAEIEEDDFVIKKFYDIGIAVAAEEGLVVPVVRNADRLSFAQIEKEIAKLAQKARQNKLSLRELQGGTFTITNGGVFGSLLSTPILNTPQVGILGMHKIQTRPVAIDEERMENRPMMYIALSYDHRIVDGKEAVQFLVRVKELLEDPETLLIEG